MKKWNGYRLGWMLALILMSAAGATAQPAPKGEMKGMEEAKGKMMEGCQEMKAAKQRLKQDTQTQNDALVSQLAAMNRAPESAKMGLMAAVVTKMAEQKMTMDARKAKMEEEMMKHMMLHMQMGKESMAQCPMMKEMGDKPTGAHHE